MMVSAWVGRSRGHLARAKENRVEMFLELGGQRTRNVKLDPLVTQRRAAIVGAQKVSIWCWV
jgi:hypothetical protein